MDAATAWDDARTNIVALASRPGAEATPVPACPDWDVKGVVAHLTGIAKGVVGALDDIAEVNSDAATADQVQLRADRPLDEIVAEWDSYRDGYLARLRDPEAHGLDNLSVMLSVFDIASHEHDIRSAIGAEGNRDSFGVELGVKMMMAGLKQRQAEHDLPSLRVEIPGWRTYDVGPDEPALHLTASKFDLLRSVSGRRTRAQVAAMDWNGPPGVWLDHWVTGVFAWSTTEHES